MAVGWGWAVKADWGSEAAVGSGVAEEGVWGLVAAGDWGSAAVVDLGLEAAEG